MILYIDTVGGKEIILRLLKGKVQLVELIIPAERRQAEELLPGIEKLLKDNGFKLADIKKIKVNNSGGSFTSLRIGVVTANALAFALDVPIEGQEKSDLRKKGKVQFVAPRYNQDPQIVIKKNILE